MGATRTSLRTTLTEALSAHRYEDAAVVLEALEAEANQALAGGEIEALVSIRGRMSRLRRAAAAEDANWPGLDRMCAVDRTLGAAVTGLQLALRREQPLEVPERVARAARPRRTSRPTVRERALAALDDKPRRPVEIMTSTGIGKRQLFRALNELVERGQARPIGTAAGDERASFYQRVA
jgi:hypothetical protein